MPTPQKEATVAQLREDIATSQAILLADFSGVTAGMMADVRGKLIAAGGKVEVVKNRLMRLALQGTPGEELAVYLKGQTIVTFCNQDPLAPAKVMKDFAKTLNADRQSWIVKAALVDGKIFPPEKARALADLPSVEEIKSGAVGAIAGPLTSVVNTFSGVLRDVVYTLQAVADKRGE